LEGADITLTLIALVKKCYGSVLVCITTVMLGCSVIQSISEHANIKNWNCCLCQHLAQPSVCQYIIFWETGVPRKGSGFKPEGVRGSNPTLNFH